MPITHVHVEDHGAKGDGVSDDTGALQAAAIAAQIRGTPMHFDAKVYAISAPIILSDFVSLHGTPRSGDPNYTIIKAKSAMSTLVEMQNSREYVLHDITLEGNFLADHCLVLKGASNCRFENINAFRARKDGIYLPSGYVNDCNRWNNLSSGGNGVLYCTPDLRSAYEGAFVLAEQISEVPNATAACSIGSNVLTFDGVDLTTLGLRTGDPLFLDSSVLGQKYFVIREVLSATELRTVVAADASDDELSFALGRGDGYREEGSGDNSLSTFDAPLMRSNAGFAARFGGLYGPRMIGGRMEYTPFWACCFAAVAPDGGSNPVLDPVFIGTYFEAWGRKPILFHSALGVGLYNLVAPLGGDLYDNIGGQSRGIRVSDFGIEPIGFVRNTLASTLLYDGVIQGHSGFLGMIVQPLIANGTNDWPSNYWSVSTEAFDVNLTGTPTIAIRPGKILLLQNNGPSSFTLQDESELPGSKLKLRSPLLTVQPDECIQLLCGQSFWYQVGV